MSDYIHNHRGAVAAVPEADRDQHLPVAGDALYREVFDDTPVAIMIEDWSGAKTMVSRLARRGGEGLAALFRATPRPSAQGR